MVKTTMCLKRMSFPLPKEGVVQVFFPKPKVKNSHTTRKVWEREECTILLTPSEGGMYHTTMQNL